MIHYYIGQRFRVKATGETGRFDFYYHEAKEPIGSNDLVKSDYSIDEIQLILRPLDSMTEEEREEWRDLPPVGKAHENEANRTNWLISKEFDIFSMHKKGQAIYENEL